MTNNGGDASCINLTALCRAAIQFSASISVTAPTASLRLAEQFILAHGDKEHNEIALAIYWRIFLTEPKSDDRLGAWHLLDFVLGHAASGTARKFNSRLADDICNFLPQLVNLCWDEPRLPELSARREVYEAIRKRLNHLLGDTMRKRLKPLWHTAPENDWKPNPEADFDHVICTCSFLLKREGARPSLAKFIADCWNIKDVKAALGSLSAQEKTDAARKALLASSANAGNLPRYTEVHPKAREWMLRLLEPHCLKCDTWQHSAHRCPCTQQHVDGLKPTPRRRCNEIFDQYNVDAEHRNCKTVDSVFAVLDAAVARLKRNEPVEELLGALDSARNSSPTPPDTRSALYIISSYGLLPSQLRSPRLQTQVYNFFVSERRLSEARQFAKSMRRILSTFDHQDIGTSDHLTDSGFEKHALEEFARSQEPLFVFCLLLPEFEWCHPRSEARESAKKGLAMTRSFLSKVEGGVPQALLSQFDQHLKAPMSGGPRHSAFLAYKLSSEVAANKELVENLRDYIGNYDIHSTRMELSRLRRKDPTEDPFRVTQFIDPGYESLLLNSELAKLQHLQQQEPRELLVASAIWRMYPQLSECRKMEMTTLERVAEALETTRTRSERVNLLVAAHLILECEAPFCGRCRNRGHSKRSCLAALQEELGDQFPGSTLASVRLRPWAHYSNDPIKQRLIQAIQHHHLLPRIPEEVGRACEGLGQRPHPSAPELTRAAAQYGGKAVQEDLARSGDATRAQCAAVLHGSKAPTVCFLCSEFTHRTQECKEFDAEGRKLASLISALEGQGVSLREFARTGRAGNLSRFALEQTCGSAYSLFKTKLDEYRKCAADSSSLVSVDLKGAPSYAVDEAELITSRHPTQVALSQHAATYAYGNMLPPQSSSQASKSAENGDNPQMEQHSIRNGDAAAAVAAPHQPSALTQEEALEKLQKVFFTSSTPMMIRSALTNREAMRKLKEAEKFSQRSVEEQASCHQIVSLLKRQIRGVDHRSSSDDDEEDLKRRRLV